MSSGITHGLATCQECGFQLIRRVKDGEIEEWHHVKWNRFTRDHEPLPGRVIEPEPQEDADE